MARFTKNVLWTQKPPQGTVIVPGNYAPDVIACPFNETPGGKVIFNYATGPFNFPRSGTTVNTVTSYVGGRRGSRLRVTDVNTAMASFTNGGSFTPTVGVTIICGFKKTDATLRSSGAFGTNAASRLGAHCPFSDGVVYWDWDNAGAGFRISKSGLTFGDDIWAFTMGPVRGQEIWQNGILVATGSYGGTRTASSQDYIIGNHNTTLADLVDWDFFYMWSYQLPQGAVQQICERPFKVFDGSYKTKIWAGFPAGFLPITETLSDTLVLSDAIGLGFGNALFDSFTFSDAFTTLVPILGLSLSDTLSLSDFAASTLGLIISEQLLLSDLLDYGLSLPLSDSDSITLSDAVIFLIGVGLGKSDTLTFSDVLRIATDVRRTLGDNILLSDFLVTLLAGLPTYSDSFALSDTARLGLSLGLSQNDSLVLSDAVLLAIVNNLIVTKSDTLNLSDNIELSLTGTGNLDQYIRHWLNDVPR